MKNIKQNGFTLLEVMIALLVFAVGLLGTLDSSVRSTRISMDNNARAMMSSIASQEVEKLYIDAGQVSAGTLTEAQFITSLSGIDGNTITTNSGKDTFTINVTQAIDNNDADALTAADVMSPVRVVFEVTYVGLKNTMKTKTNYTFVWDE